MTQGPPDESTVGKSGEDQGLWPSTQRGQLDHGELELQKPSIHSVEPPLSMEYPAGEF